MASNRVPPVGGTTASTSSAGIVQLTDSTSSTSTTTAATPASVKTAYDLANGAIAKTLTTTTGDIIYASGANTPARLGIGSTDQVLKVSGGVPSWAAASSGNLAKVSSQTFSATNLVTFDGVFDNTYDTYYVLFEEIKSAYPYSGLLKLKWRKSSANVTGSAMTYARVHVASTGATNWTFDLASGQNEAPLFPTDNRPGGATLWITPRNSTQFPCYRGIAEVGSTQGMPTIVSGLLTSYESNIDGFSISTVSNISGIITVYGVKV